MTAMPCFDAASESISNDLLHSVSADLADLRYLPLRCIEKPARQVKATYFLDDSSMGICQYPEARSISEKRLAVAKNEMLPSLLPG
jgi:hypothetical protein